MTARRITERQRRANRELCALARVGIDVCDMIAERGEENHEAPRYYLSTLERWTRGEASWAELWGKTRTLDSWGGSLSKGQSRGETARLVLYLSLSLLGDSRVVKRGTAAWRERALRGFAVIVAELYGDTMVASTCRVDRLLDHHRGRSEQS